MKQWYTQLSVREKSLVKVGGTLVVLALFWAFVYIPLNQTLDKKSKRLAELNSQLLEMQATANNVNQLSEQIVVSPLQNGLSFSSWIDRQLESWKLTPYIRRSEPINENSITLWLQNAPFDVTMDWLQAMQRQYTVAIDQLDSSSTDRQAGLATIRITLNHL